MRDEFIIYHMTKVMNKFLEGIAEKVPLAPLDAVRKNVLLFSQDGGKTTILQNFNAHFLDFIKTLQAASDEEAGLQIVPDGEEPKEPVYMEPAKAPPPRQPNIPTFADLGKVPDALGGLNVASLEASTRAD